jgi:hypothetical protein
LTRKQIGLLFLIALAALLVHGYHPAVEDAEIYLPAVKKNLNPALYPFGTEFFMSHARMTLFDELIAASVRLSHLPFDFVVFFWHFACIFLLLWACWRIGRKCFHHPLAPWGGAALLAALLTIPVAGTSLYIMDQYLTTRDLSTAGLMVVMANVIEKRCLRAAVWSVLIAVIHPLMVVFGVALSAIFLWEERRRSMLDRAPAVAGAGRALLLAPLLTVRPVSDAYREVLDTRSYFFVVRWQWYEWLGIFASLALLWWISRYGERRALPAVATLGRALIMFGLLFLAAALVLSLPPLASLGLLQPMRSLHLIFIFNFVLLGGVLAESVLKYRFWRWLVLLVPLALLMFFVQRQLFPATEHLELPGRAAKNPWVQAFEWIRYNTPRDALFALNPAHMELPGEDQHGFRVVAERSMLADALKDSGAVSMFPAMAERWREQVRAQQGWQHFQLADFERLRRDWGVTWLVLEAGLPMRAEVARSGGKALGLDCPFQNYAVSVCRFLGSGTPAGTR